MTRAIRLALLLASAASVAMLARCALAREAEAPAPVRECRPHDAYPILLCQIGAALPGCAQALIPCQTVIEDREE